MAVQYDPNIIVTFAERLYQQARTIVVKCALLGGLVGVAAGGTILFTDNNGTPLALALVVVCTLVGAAIGQARGFTLRLQAQTALCQLQIEVNTRGAVGRRVA